MTHKTLSTEGLQRIQAFEGFQSASVALTDGRFLSGHGHVSASPKSMTRAEAAELLRSDLAPAERAVNALVSASLTQSQFDALVSFAFSIGIGAFAKCEVVRRVNAGEFAAAACAMDAWRKSAVSGQSEVVEALVRRRAQEKAMLMDAPQRGAPSAWLKPELDHAAAILAAPVRLASLPLLSPEAHEEPLLLTQRKEVEPAKSVHAVLMGALGNARRALQDAFAAARRPAMLPQT